MATLKECCITPHISIPGSPWQQITTVSVHPGQDLTFGPSLTPAETDGGIWSWRGPNGFRSNERQNQLFDFNASMAGQYVGTYTNEAGCRDQLTITLTLAELYLKGQYINLSTVVQ